MLYRHLCKGGGNVTFLSAHWGTVLLFVLYKSTIINPLVSKKLKSFWNRKQKYCRRKLTYVKEEATKGLETSGAVKIFTLFTIFFEL